MRTTTQLNDEILLYHGQVNQIRKTEEELTELLLSCKRVLSGKIDVTEHDFLQEIADVKNMIEQIEISLPLYAVSRIKEIQHEKALRELGRIKNG